MGKSSKGFRTSRLDSKQLSSGLADDIFGSSPVVQSLAQGRSAVAYQQHVQQMNVLQNVGQSLGNLSGQFGQFQNAERHRAINVQYGMSGVGEKHHERPKTFREELQQETDEWLPDPNSR